MSQTESLKVLFLCTANSCRSQISEAWLRILGGGRFEVYSAGLDPHGVNPLAKVVMQEVGYDMGNHRSKHIDLYIGKKQFDFLISVCAESERNCPYFPGAGQRLHWEVEDPTVFKGSKDQKLKVFRQTRDLIRKEIEDWLSDLQQKRIGKSPKQQMTTLTQPLHSSSKKVV